MEDYITVPRINLIVKYWGENCPPAHKSLAAMIHFKPKAKEVDFQDPKFLEAQEQAAEAFMKMFPQRSAPPK